MVKKFVPPIKYTDRDFRSIKQSLMSYAKKYYPNTAADFNEASFGSLMLDMVSYIGDVMSFYLDYQATESFLDSSIEFNNVIRLAKQTGYKYDPDVTAYGAVALYIKVPANTNGLGPDRRYLPVLKRNTRFSTSQENITFLLLEDVDFNISTNQTIVSDVDTITGNPLYYAIKAYAPVMSGDIVTTSFTTGEYAPFKKFDLEVDNLAEIISVVDSEGNEYFEVDYLSQDVIYTDVENKENDRDLIPTIFKAVSVPRRFTVEKTDETVFLQFGEGDNTDALIENDKKLDPSSVALKMHGKDYISDESFDPFVLVKNNNLGIGPTNTTITVIYRTNLTDTINVGVGDITNIASVALEFADEQTLSPVETNRVFESIEVSNEEIIVGVADEPGIEEIKLRAINSFAAQNRAVTKQDYISLVYSMPGKFGSIKRAKIMQDKDSFKRNLNLYVVSEGLDGTLLQTKPKIKTNLKNWLSQYKMLNDTIDIVDANIINLRIEFIAISETNTNKYAVKDSATSALHEFFSRRPEIGEPIYITDIYNVLNEAAGVADISDVDIYVQNGGIYSNYYLDIKQYTSPDGRFIKFPEDVIYEIKFVEDDIKGVVL